MQTLTTVNLKIITIKAIQLIILQIINNKIFKIIKSIKLMTGITIVLVFHLCLN